MEDLLRLELLRRAKIGQHPRTVAEIETALSAIGYKLDRSMDCSSIAQWANGPSYPCTTTGINEADTGKSFANCDARRDDNFKALQEMRFSGDWFSVLEARQTIFEI